MYKSRSKRYHPYMLEDAPPPPYNDDMYYYNTVYDEECSILAVPPRILIAGENRHLHLRLSENINCVLRIQRLGHTMEAFFDGLERAIRAN